MNKTLTVLLILVGFISCKNETKKKKHQRPNVVFILADDLGAVDLSNEGSTYYESPNIDEISRLGMKFTRGYASCQVCSPSRASIMTGKYTPNHGITDWIGAAVGESWRKRKRSDSHMPPGYDHALRASEVTLAEALQANGYETFFAGKWHLGDKGSWPEDHGFMTNVGGYDAGSPRGGYFSPYNNPNLTNGPKGESLPIRLGTETANFIEANQNKPFLAYLSFYSVHGPIQTSSKLWKKYRDKAVSAGEVEERFLFDRKLSVRQVQDCPIYGGMIESMDDGVGIVLDKLKELGLMENTIICFTSDNGGVSSGDAYSTSCLPYRGGKGRQWEGGIREPFYMYAPGITTSGTTSTTPVNGIDWYPTILELTGTRVPSSQKVDGVSMVPLLKGESIAKRPLFWHYPHYGNQGGDPSSIIMEDNWKLIYYHEDGHSELYNLTQDIGEQNDISSIELERSSAMKSRLDQWLKSTNAKMPMADPLFNSEDKEAYLDRQRTKGKARLEKYHKKMLNENYVPNKNWWDSE